jgi:hypothetical protein
MDKEYFKYDEEWLLKQITPRGNGLTLKSARPKDGIAGYVWRMIRFHSGIDLHHPTSCYYHLFDQLKDDGLIDGNFSGIIYESQKEILDKLDILIVKCTEKLGLSHFTAAKRYRGILY